MAAAKATNGSGNGNVANGTSAQNPDEAWEKDGFQRVNPEVYFWKPASEEGDHIVKHPIQGIVLARAERVKSDRDLEDEKRTGKNKGPQFFYLVALTKPCDLRDHDKQKVPGVVGMVAWVDERFTLQPLQNMLPKVDESTGRPVRVSEVGIVPDKRVPTAAGNNVWKFKLYRKDHEAAKAGVPLLSPAEATAMVQTAQSKAASAPTHDDDEPAGRETYDASPPF